MDLGIKVKIVGGELPAGYLDIRLTYGGLGFRFKV